MKLTEISLWEEQGVDRALQPVSFGVPFAKGVVRDIAHLRLVYRGHDLPADCRATQVWPDGSVRWCLIDTIAPLPAGSAQVLELHLDEHPGPSPQGVLVRNGSQPGESCVDTGAAQFWVRTDQIGLARADRSASLSALSLEHATGDAQASMDGSSWSAEQACALVTLFQQGDFRDDAGRQLCRFESQLSFFAGTAQVHWQLTLHNPAAARHPGGLWDLGDPASILLKEVTATLAFPEGGSTSLQVEDGSQWLSGGPAGFLFQASSGGDHWDARTHVDRTAQVPLAFKGYQASLGGESVDGLRASPLLFHSAGVGIYLDRFWQNFPKALAWNAREISLQLFPAACGYEHELQPGERKTHHMRFDFGAGEVSNQQLRTLPFCHLDPVYVASCGVVQHFSPQREPLDDLIQIGLHDQVGFEAKREVIDEYGWRNFGDIFADHESLYLPEGQIFISHYNNQYDPLYGFLRQYLLTGDSRWMRMADELAWHVGDIDIYSTKDDRDEYNGGLFWHTDHYVCAFTASHRTYSKFQRPNGKDVTQGGGPGAEHCYTHGLMLHYSLTGCERSRQAVLQLTEWITHFYEGTGAVLDKLMDIKKRVLPRVRAASGARAVLDHRYPFNRGVGNYLNGLLDCLALTGDRHYLRRAEQVISGTFSPLDDIADRCLADVETTWFYTIFLQAVARFLEVKKQHDETQTVSYVTTVSAFMKYARWIAEQETPYLTNPAILEYPNDTWAAQDIRKAAILFYASGHAENQAQREQLMGRAQYFYGYVLETLKQSPTRHYSRILAILMQNHGVYGYFTDKRTTLTPAPELIPLVSPSPYRGRMAILSRALLDVLAALMRFSVRRELGWLRHRHEGSAKLYARMFGAAQNNR